MLKRISQYITPNFLKEIDQRLLTTYPHLWISKIHMIFSYGIVISTIILLIVFATPTLPYKLPPIDAVFPFIALLSLMCFGIWIYAVSRFKIHDSFGQTSPTKELQNIGIYYFCIVLLILIPCLHPIALHYKISRTVSTQELISDINTWNLGIIAFDDDLFLEDTTLPIKSVATQQALWNTQLTKK